MQWELLTSDDFAAAVRETGVCIVPMGVLERHGPHLPLGTDMLMAHRVACMAASREPAVVFPPFYYGQIYEARCFPGTLAIPPATLTSVIVDTLDEIGRNGFRKIVLHNGHGGNWNLFRFIAQATLAAQKPYTLYVQTELLTPERASRRESLLETKYHGHACECETSCMMSFMGEHVHGDRIPREPGEPLGRTKNVPGAFAGIWWYGSHPEHYAGDARPASAEKGQVLMDLLAESLADFVRAVKADNVAPALEDEFFRREESIRK